MNVPRTTQGAAARLVDASEEQAPPCLENAACPLCGKDHPVDVFCSDYACAGCSDAPPATGPTLSSAPEPNNAAPGASAAPVVHRWMADVELRLPGGFTFEACPDALAALNAAYGWPGGTAPAPEGLSDATWRARATWKIRLPVALRRDGSIELDAMTLAKLAAPAKGA